MWGLWVAVETISKNTGSLPLGDSSAENRVFGDLNSHHLHNGSAPRVFLMLMKTFATHSFTFKYLFLAPKVDTMSETRTELQRLVNSLLDTVRAG